MKAIRRFFPLAFVLFFYFVFFIRCGPGEKTPGFCEAMGFKCLEMLCPPIYDYSDGVVKADDVGDGTIQVSVTTKSGTRCSPRNSVRTFFVKKCLQGQIFQAGTGDCKAEAMPETIMARFFCNSVQRMIIPVRPQIHTITVRQIHSQVPQRLPAQRMPRQERHGRCWIRTI